LTRPARKKSRRERRAEAASFLTHAGGALLGVAGAGFIVGRTVLQGGVRRVVAGAVYGASLTAAYTASALYHACRRPRAKRVLRIVDHAGIYLLIAGTYTPLTLVTLRGAWGWSMLGAVWGFALGGVALKVLFLERLQKWSTPAYLLLGSMILVAWKPLRAVMPDRGVAWLLAGGSAYASGTLFFSWRRFPYSHAVWHLFALAGSAAHYVAIARYVLAPGRAVAAPAAVEGVLPPVLPPRPPALQVVS
jgi:hemolysin III